MSKVKRNFKTTFAICLICIAMFTTTVHAASRPGPDSFTPGTQWFAGEMTFTNNNWTPTKTLLGQGFADEFWINGYFKKADNYNGLVKLTVKIKRCSDNKIIDSGVFYPNADGSGNFNTGRIPVNPNEEKIQVFYDASTYNATPPGPYRSLYVIYDFALR